jgi:surface protein
MPVPDISNIPGPSRPGYPGGGTENAFIMRVQTDISTSSVGKSNDDQFLISVNPSVYTFDYNVDWGDGNTDSNVTGNITHTYASIGTYDIKITGTFPNIYFFNRFDRYKVLEIKNWGNIEWLDMSNSFYGCQNMTITATDQPDFSRVTRFYRAFNGCVNMTLPSADHVANWVTSNCVTVELMFALCRSITSLDCSTWDTSNVTMFRSVFNQMRAVTSIDVSNWDTSSGSNFDYMFYLNDKVTSLTGIEDFRFRTSGNVGITFMFRDIRVFNGNNNDGVLDLSGWNMTSANLFSLSNTFRNMYLLTRLNLSNWDVSNVTTLSQVFLGSRELQTIDDIDTWNTLNVTDFRDVFHQCRSLTADVSSWNTSNGTLFAQAFYGLSKIGSQRISGYDNWDLSSASSTNNNSGRAIFAYSVNGQSTFTDGFPSNWNFGNGRTLELAFRRTNFNETNITCNITTSPSLLSCNQTFMEIGRYGADSITFTNNFDVSGVTDARYMFASNSSPISAEFGISFPSGTDWGSVTTFQNFLVNTTLSSADYNALLIDIEASNQNNNVIFDAPLCAATGAGLTARNALINDHSWTINDNS